MVFGGARGAANPALASGELLRDFAATALVAVASDHQTLCAQVGDGAIVVRASAAAPFDVAFWPGSGEYVNHTFFLTDENAAQRIGIRRFDAVQDVVAISDGLQKAGAGRGEPQRVRSVFRAAGERGAR